MKILSTSGPIRAGLRAVAAALMLAGLVSCGGGGGSGAGSGPGSAPVISNLSFDPTGAYVQTGGGTVDVIGQLEFTDADGDLATLILTIQDAGGQVLETRSDPIQGVAGLTRGTLGGSVTVSTTNTGRYTFRVEVVDAQGLRSAALSGAFRIAEFPWVAVASLPAPRTGFATATVNGLIYLIGGDDPNATTIPPPATGRVDVFDPATATWTDGVSMTVPMQDHTARIIGGTIYAIGSAGSITATEVEAFDTNPRNWASLPAVPTVHSLGSVAVAAGRLHVMGGNEGGMPTAVNESVDPAVGVWRTDAPMLTARRQLRAVTVDLAAAGAAPRPQVHALGGVRLDCPLAGYCTTHEAYDPLTNTWLSRAAMPTALAHPGATVFDGTILTFGGENVARSVDTVMRYDPVTDAWTFRTEMPAPATRVQAETIGRKVYVFTATTVYSYTPDDDLR